MKCTHRLAVLIQAPATGDNPSSKEMQMHGEQLKTRHLTQRELADRWNKSEATIERYRSDGVGPKYLKIGGKVMYRLEDIEQFELDCLYESPNSRIAPTTANSMRGVTA
jgi:predicted DNA-binding transcriptional regulator AlpA